MKRKIDECIDEKVDEIKHRKIFHVDRVDRKKSNKRKNESEDNDEREGKRSCNTDILTSAYAKYFEEVCKTYYDPNQESFTCENFEETKAYYIY